MRDLASAHNCKKHLAKTLLTIIKRINQQELIASLFNFSGPEDSGLALFLSPLEDEEALTEEGTHIPGLYKSVICVSFTTGR